VSDPTIERVSESEFRLRGELTFGTVAPLLRESASLFQRGATLKFNLDSVDHADSAGLALLIEWLRSARTNEVSLSFANIPAKMLALARVTGVDRLVAPAETSNIN